MALLMHPFDALTSFQQALDAYRTSGWLDSTVSGGKKDAITRGHYQKGVVVFTIAKGGLMGQLAVAGQKFSYTPREAS